MAGSRIKGITIEIDGNTTALSSALRGVNDDLVKTQSRLTDIQRLLKLDPTNTQLLGQKYSELQTKITDTKTKLDALKEASKQAEKQLEEGEISSEKYDALQREIIKTEQDLKKLEGTVGSGSEKLAQLSVKSGEFGTKIKDVGNKLMPVSLGLAAIGTAAGKAAVDFETAFAGVTKTVDGTPEQLEKIKQGILDLSQNTASSATDIAAVAEAAGQLGIKTEDIMTFTETMVELGDSTNLSAEGAASALAQLSNITGMSADDYSKLGSAIVDLGNNYATTESDIVSMSTNLASTATIAGLTEPDILGLATAMSSVGIEAEAGGTAMSKLIQQIQTDVETGSGDLESFASVAGMTADEFKTAFEEDAAGAIGAFISGLSDTERNGQSAIAILDQMGIKEARLSRTILSLAGSGDLMSEAIETANSAWEDNNALTEEAARRYETTAAKLTQLKNSGTEIAVALGESFLPVVQNVADGVKAVADKMSELSTPAQSVITTLILMGAASGPVLSGIGSVSLGVSTLTGHFSKASTESSGLFEVLKAHPYAALGAAAIAAGLGIAEAVSSTREARDAANEYSEANEKNIESIEASSEKAELYAGKLDELVGKENKSAQDKAMIKEYVDRLNESVDGLNLKYDEETGKLSENTDAINKKIEAMREEAMTSAYIKQSQEALDKATNSQIKLTEAQENMTAAQEAYDEAAKSGYVSQQLSTDLAKAETDFNDLKVATDTYWQEYTKQSNNAAIQSGQWDDLVEDAKRAGIDIPKKLTEGIKKGAIPIPTTVDELKALIDFNDLAEKAGGSATDTVNELSQKLRDGTITAEQAAKELAKAVDKPLQDEKENAKTAGKNTGKGFKDGVKEKKEEAKNAGKDVGKNAVSGMNAATGAKNAGKSKGTSFKDGVKEKKDEAKNAGKGVGENAVSGMESVTGAYSAGQNMGKGFKEGLRSAIDTVAKAGAAIAEAALNAAKKKSEQRSPSRAWFKSGTLDVKGYTNALEAQVPNVRKSGMNLATAALDGVNDQNYLSAMSGMQTMETQFVSNFNYSQMQMAFSHALNQMNFAVVLDQRELGRGLQGMGVQFK